MLIVFAGPKPFMKNKVLNRDFMSRYHGGEALTDMAMAIQQAGFELMTIDTYMQTCPQRSALLVSDMAAGLRPKNPKLIPAICYSLESPIVASRYYHHIQAKTKSFAKIYDWAGVAPRIANSEQRFLPISWPTTTREVMSSTICWSDKKFLVMISSNKRALQWTWPEMNFHGFFHLPRALVSNVNTTWIKRVDSFMKSEVYIKRLEAIKFFSNEKSFDLFGGGWNKKQKDSNFLMQQTIEKCYRGQIPDKAKQDYLQHYKFSIVFENTIFPGYLTEKIFDCFFAGVIPIYLGDPQIEEKIPSSCFIDARKFPNYEYLADYLHSMSTEEAAGYLHAASTFISSSEFEPFTSSFFANTIVQTLNEIKLKHD